MNPEQWRFSRLHNYGPAATNIVTFIPPPITNTFRLPAENDIITFEQLKQLRKNAFGGSDGSLGSSQPRASPTNQHFPGSVPMAFAYSTGSSSSGDRAAINESPEHASQRTSHCSIKTHAKQAGRGALTCCQLHWKADS